MSNEPIRRILRWKRLEIGVTHDPLFGDSRHGRKITAGYGHIRGSYGDAEDGMSIDVYIGPDLGAPDIFRVRQIIPQTGEFDEYKYIIGTWSPEEAQALFLANMPERFFDGVEVVPFSDLEKYQKALSKSATGEEGQYLSQLWGLGADDRLAVQMNKKAIVALGNPLPPIHCVLFEA